MAAEPTLEPTLAREEEEQEDIDDGEESDVYEFEVLSFASLSGTCQFIFADRGAAG